jgi:hypothetical protein
MNAIRSSTLAEEKQEAGLAMPKRLCQIMARAAVSATKAAIVRRQTRSTRWISASST